MPPAPLFQRGEPFIPGSHDFAATLQPAQTLYGRAQEISLLQEALQRVNAGRSEMLLVAGYSGVGKTSLVREIHPAVAQQRGYFITGKFDQYQRNVPYAAFTAAFAELARQLLAESEPRFVRWREAILEAVGPNAQIITEVIPDMALVTGPVAEIPALPPVESQNRFNLVFRNFIKVFTRPAHPLVIFLDDLHWADSASLKLMRLLMESGDMGAVIGAYRDNEVTAAHPLLLSLKEIKAARAKVGPPPAAGIGGHHPPGGGHPVPWNGYSRWRKCSRPKPRAIRFS